MVIILVWWLCFESLQSWNFSVNILVICWFNLQWPYISGREYRRDQWELSVCHKPSLQESVLVSASVVQEGPDLQNQILWLKRQWISSQAARFINAHMLGEADSVSGVSFERRNELLMVL